MKTASSLTCDEILNRLQALADPTAAVGMAHFGSRPGHALGISIPNLRQIARGQRSHALALELWTSGIHEARILASMVDDPAQVTREQMDAWAADFDSWDVCDQVCLNLFHRTPYALECILAWSAREEEYVRRAGFVLIATLGVHDKKAEDEFFLQFLPIIVRYSTDSRNFVKKAVNWALRQIGKRNPALRQAAISTAEQIKEINSPTARWIANDALRELRNDSPKRLELQ